MTRARPLIQPLIQPLSQPLRRTLGTAAGSTLALALLAGGCVFAALAGPALSLHTRTEALQQTLGALPATSKTIQVTGAGEISPRRSRMRSPRRAGGRTRTWTTPTWARRPPRWQAASRPPGSRWPAATGPA